MSDRPLVTLSVPKAKGTSLEAQDIIDDCVIQFAKLLANSPVEGRIIFDGDTLIADITAFSEWLHSGKPVDA